MKQPSKVIDKCYVIKVNGLSEDRFSSLREAKKFIRDIESNPEVEFIELIKETVVQKRIKLMRPENKVVLVSAEELGSDLSENEIA